MSKCPGLHCKGCGDGNGAGAVLAVIAVLLTCAAIAKPAMHAAGAVLHFVVTALEITGIVLAGAALAGWAGHLAWRARQRRAAGAQRAVLYPPAAPRAVPARSAAPELPATREVHLHLHGVTAGEAAAFVRQARPVYGTFDEHPPALEEG